MYKNPELSTKARILAHELKALGLELKHTQALELLAKTEGVRNLHVLQAAVETPAGTTPNNVLQGQIFDWTEFDSDSKARQTDRQKQVFDARADLHGDGMLIRVALPHMELSELDGTDQLSLRIEISNGRPVVEISNDEQQAPPLRITACPGGLYLEPTSSATPIISGIPRNRHLREVQDEQHPNGRQWDMFVENPNYET